jgi:hypothetical protein
MARDPAKELLRKIARKQKMIEDYERIVRECTADTAVEKSVRKFLSKRAADFREEKRKLEAQLRKLKGP